MSAFSIIAVIFLLFAASRTLLRHRDGSITLKETLFWMVFWAVTTIVVVWPGKTNYVAGVLGIQRGADVAVYLSIILIFYLVFRIYIKINVLNHDLTRLIRAMAVEEAASNKKVTTK